MSELDSAEAVQEIKAAIEELKRDRRQDMLEARQAISSVQIQLNDLTVRVALLNNNLQELPGLKISIEALKVQATEISVERKAERKTAAMIWTGLIGIVGLLSTFFTWVATGKPR